MNSNGNPTSVLDLKAASWRHRPIRTLTRVGFSLIRRRVAAFRRPLVSYDDGRSRIIADLKTALGLGLYRYGHADPELNLVRALLQPGDVFVDGGANVGLFTLVAAARVGPTGNVLAFEPAPWTVARLRDNLAANKFPWVQVYEAALSESRGKLDFVSFVGDAAGFSSFAPDGKQQGNSYTVNTVPLDEAVPAEKRQHLTVVKLDLEGAEYRALLGAKSLVHDVGPDWLLEVDAGHLARQQASVECVLETFRTAGYVMYLTLINSGNELLLREVTELPVSRSSPNILFSRRLKTWAPPGLRISR